MKYANTPVPHWIAGLSTEEILRRLRKNACGDVNKIGEDWSPHYRLEILKRSVVASGPLD